MRYYFWYTISNDQGSRCLSIISFLTQVLLQPCHITTQSLYQFTISISGCQVWMISKCQVYNNHLKFTTSGVSERASRCLTFLSTHNRSFQGRYLRTINCTNNINNIKYNNQIIKTHKMPKTQNKHKTKVSPLTTSGLEKDRAYSYFDTSQMCH